MTGTRQVHDIELLSRAICTYVREHDITPSTRAEVVEVATGIKFVVVIDGNRLLATYRVRADGRLMRATHVGGRQLLPCSASSSHGNTP